MDVIASWQVGITKWCTSMGTQFDRIEQIQDARKPDNGSSVGLLTR